MTERFLSYVSIADLSQSRYLPFSNPWVTSGVLVVLTSLSHAIFRRHEPTFFGYIYGVGFSLIILAFLSRSFLLAIETIIIANFLLGLQILFHRLAWHELLAFPGPRIAAVSQFWVLREAYLGRTRFTMQKLGAKYGDWVRIGPNELYTGSVDALWAIMGPKGWAKGASYDSGITKDRQGGDSVLTLKTLADHALRRRIWEKAFTPKAIASYLPAIEARIDQFLGVLEDHVLHHQPLDLCLQLGYFTYDSMTDMAFGGGTNLLITQKDEHGILHHMGRVVQQVGIIRNVPWVTPLVNSLSNPQLKEQSTFREFTKLMFERRLKQGLATEIDVFHYLLGEDTETKTKLSVSELLADSTLVIIAGADTTRTVLIALLLYLLRSQEHMSRLQSALEATDLTPASLAKIPYLDACLKEAMRLQPPSPANLQRVCPPEGAVIDGRRIPGGTKVRLSNWAMQRDARYFEAPEVFWPERWLTSPSPAQPHTPRALFAFMIGPGTCVAKNLALMEMRLVVAHLLTRYEVQFSPGFDHMAFERSWTDAYLLLIEEPFLIQLKPRNLAR